MTQVDITGPAIPRLSRREIGDFVGQVLRALRSKRIARGAGEVSIAFVSDETMQSLNRSFRRKNRTTDVLTFPADPADYPGGPLPLGDIVISVDQARRQARLEHHSLAMEIRYLILHGILHALGYDHETDQGEMNALELETRQRVGLG